MAPKLLVVDDDAAVRESFVRLLRYHGYAVEESSSGRGAVQQLRSHAFDLAVIDWRLGDMTGIDVAQAMRDDGVLTPWVLISGYLDFDIATQAGRLGVIKTAGYPVDIHALVSESLKEAASRGNGWVWPVPPALTDDMTAVELWAALVLRGCDAKRDPATIHAWRRAAGTSEATIYATCKVLKIAARESRDFMRMLRALRKGAGCVGSIEAHLVFHDLRTWDALRGRAGLRDRSPELVISCEEFLRAQRFVSQTNPAFSALKAFLPG